MTKARELSDYTGLQGDLALKSPVASPVFTGNVGVGVTPESWLSTYPALQIGAGGCVTGSNDGSFVSLNGNAYVDSVNSRYEYINSAYASQYQQYDGKHIFQVAPSGTADAAISWTTAMTIANDGKLSFGGVSSSYGAQITIGYDGYAGTIAGVTRGLQLNSGITSGSDAMLFLNPNGVVGAITTIGSSTSYATSSDYRLKENVTPMSGATAQTKLLKPCNFDWIAGGNVNGFLAHELAEVVPEAVTGTKDAMDGDDPVYQGIDQSKLVPLLTATIQELIARIEALEGE